MSNRSSLFKLNEISHKIADAMTDSGVKPDDSSLLAVMVVIAKDEESDPVAASLNWDKEKEEWRVDLQVDAITPAEGGQWNLNH